MTPATSPRYCQRMWASSGRAKIILGVAILLVVLVIGVVVANSSDSSKTSNRSTAEARDGFKRANASTLGKSANGVPWTAVHGTWGIRDNAAYVAKSAAALKRNIALIDMVAPDGTVKVKLKTMASGSGLIFRYASPFDYWVVYSVPKYAFWNVAKVQGLKAEPVTSFQGRTRDGTTVSVRMNGSALDFYIDGILRKSARDPSAAGAKRVGLAAAGPDASKARFEAFVAPAQSFAAPYANNQAPAGTTPATTPPVTAPTTTPTRSTPPST